MSSLKSPDLGPRQGWTEVQLIQHLLDCRSFVSGAPDGDGLRVRYYKRDRDGRVVGRVWFGPATEGPPEHAHGGSMAAVLDESLAAAAWLEGYVVLSAELTVRYRRPLPLGTTATMEAWVDHVNGRKVTARGHLLDDDNKPFCEGKLLLVVLDNSEHAEKIAQVEEILDEADSEENAD